MGDLDWFKGTWDVVSRSLNANGEWEDEENLQAEHSAILGGHAIFEHFDGVLMGKPFEAWSIRKFNPQENQWEQRWVDTTPGGFADWTGHWDRDSSIFIGHPNRVITPDGLADKAVREVFFDINDDRFSWKYETSEDGGDDWTLKWSLEYTRANG